ncbi:hypothetical protein CVIRNUC_006820 [Coccomyxa viridis]|uniref:Uncharacterized protein n=1 Tax=Coccomyxa viridis TaxID=1274662 RepID=A0AAV1IA72_9CHLO|nr:hypothetical protein CVIRNUC_006820 [Coccomyxa viridis]
MEEFKIDLTQNEENAVCYEVHTEAADASAQQLQELQDKVVQAIKPYFEGYIWQRDSFALQSSRDYPPPWKPEVQSGAKHSDQSTLRDFSASSIPCLWGKTMFGDNLEDEWFITWVLSEITRRIPGTAARVWDNDGEFLLMEAAYALPRWLKPETASSRVWLLDGLLHIVPLPTAAAPDIPSFPSLKQAKQIVHSSQIDTVAGQKVQEAIAARLKGYPQRAQRQMHRARVLISARAAAVLREDPQLAGPAVEAFYNRDADDMRAAAHMTHFSPQDMVCVVVTLNRCMYAQLEQQEFQAPPGFSIPPAKSPQHSAAQRGMKLAVGLEMLYARSRASGGKDSDASLAPAQPDQEITEQAVSAMPAWHAYRAGLRQKGYFKGNIPGSQQFKGLMQQALQAFTQSAAYRRAAAAARGPASRIDAVLQSAPLSTPEDERTLVEAMQGAEDDDSWMRDGADDLDRELAAREKEMGGPDAASSGNGFDAENLAQRFKAFVEKESGPEGAEVPSRAAAGRGEAGVHMSAKHFWQELGGAMGVHLDSETFLNDTPSDSDDEGSSFFVGGAGVIDSDDEGASQQDTAYMAQRAGRAAQDASLGSAPARAPASQADASHRTPLGPQQDPDTAAVPAAGSSAAPAAASKAAAPGEAPAAQKQKPASNKGFAFRFPPIGGSKPAKKNSSAQTPSAAQVEAASGSSAAQPSAAPQRQTPQQGGAHTAPAQHHARNAGRQRAAVDEQWDAATATDSDDEAGSPGSADFMSQYAAAMEAELSSSKIGTTFAKAEQPHTGGTGSSTQEQGQEASSLQPVDLDLNLVENLLASYAGQQGLPGPASNLAGLMGISLPDNQDDAL